MPRPLFAIKGLLYKMFVGLLYKLEPYPPGFCCRFLFKVKLRLMMPAEVWPNDGVIVPLLLGVA